jgi:ABC-type phosphate transport system substrate-binding protein
MSRPGFLLAAVIVLTAARQPDAEPRAPGLVVIVNPDNAATPSGAFLEDIFLRRQIEWGDGERIIMLNATSESERRRMFDRAVLGMSSDEVARYWLDQRIRGTGAAPREVGDAFLTIKLVTKLKAAIGYVPADAELHGARVVARIRDGKLSSP